MTEELRCMIALGEVRGVGTLTAKSLVAALGSARNVLFASKQQLTEVDGVGSALSTAIAEGRDAALRVADHELEFMDRYSIEAHTYTSEAYPHRLRTCDDCPIVLYHKGNADLDAQRILSIVGTRRPSPDGREMTERLVIDLSQRFPDLLIVSGLAYGVDIAAHRAALRSNLPTVGVLAHGLDRVYPAQHRDAAAQMVGQGALVSEFRSGTNPDAPNFVVRNRIVAGLADATLVIESGQKGGSLITAQMARDYGRVVLAVPGSPRNEMAHGCNQMIREGRGALVETIDDITAALDWRPAASGGKAVQGELFALPANNEEQMLYDALAAEGELSASVLSNKTGLPINVVNSTLMNMEFSGLVKALPGNRYKCLMLNA